MIKIIDGERRYFDKNGIEITDGCKIRYNSGIIKTVYLTDDGELGIDATNPHWIETGKALPCEYGIYSLGNGETDEVEVVE